MPKQPALHRKRTADKPKPRRCIAYFSTRTSTFYVTKRYRDELIRRWNIESREDGCWLFARRGYTIDVVEVNGFVPAQVQEEREGDVRTVYRAQMQYQPPGGVKRLQLRLAV
jgi:hypothetical protein